MVAASASAQPESVEVRDPSDTVLRYSIEDSGPLPPEPEVAGETANELPQPPEQDELVGYSRLVDGNSRFSVRPTANFTRSAGAPAPVGKTRETTRVRSVGSRLEVEGPFQVREGTDLASMHRVEDRVAALRKVARSFIEDKGADMIGGDADVEYTVLEAQSDRAGGAVIYQRSYRGIPIADGRVTVVMNTDGSVKRFFGKVLDLAKINSAINGHVISELEAEDVVRATLSPEQQAGHRRPELPADRLGNVTLIAKPTGAAPLVYEVSTAFKKFFVDATSGELLPY
jgi:hypothetical protein